jgi:hypothetical protein
VKVTGSNFTGVTAVRFGSTAASFTVDSETEITAVAPSGIGMEYVTLPGALVTPPGLVYVTVQTSAGTSPASASGDLFVYSPPETETPTGSGGDQLGGSGGASEGSSSSASGVPLLVSPLVKTVKPKALTSTQKLAIALKLCEKNKSKTKRTMCVRQARKRYATTARNVGKQKRHGATTGRRVRASQ